MRLVLYSTRMAMTDWLSRSLGPQAYSHCFGLSRDMPWPSFIESAVSTMLDRGLEYRDGSKPRYFSTLPVITLHY